MMKEIDKRKRVHYHGRVGQDQLAKEFMRSAVLAYPCIFEESFCITALEAMAAGCVVLSSDYWALGDTVKNAGILLPMQDNRNTVHTEEYRNDWVNNCIQLLTNNKKIKMWRNKGYERVKRFTWEAVALQWHTYFKSQKGMWNEIQ